MQEYIHTYKNINTLYTMYISKPLRPLKQVQQPGIAVSHRVVKACATAEYCSFSRVNEILRYRKTFALCAGHVTFAL